MSNDLAAASAADLAKRYRQIANSSAQWFVSPEFKTLAAELKRRKLRTFDQLDAAVRSEAP